jgi:NADH-quinone oxidoreductase subunit M
LPGLAGFWGEVMALLSAYSPAGILDEGLFRVLMVLGGIGTILTAGYFLWTLQRVNLGTLPDRWKESVLPDVHSIEWLAWAPLLASILFLGLFPRVVLGTTEEAVRALVGIFGG